MFVINFKFINYGSNYFNDLNKPFNDIKKELMENDINVEKISEYIENVQKKQKQEFLLKYHEETNKNLQVEIEKITKEQQSINESLKNLLQNDNEINEQELKDMKNGLKSELILVFIKPLTHEQKNRLIEIAKNIVPKIYPSLLKQTKKEDLEDLFLPLEVEVEAKNIAFNYFLKDKYWFVVRSFYSEEDFTKKSKEYNNNKSTNKTKLECLFDHIYKKERQKLEEE